MAALAIWGQMGCTPGTGPGCGTVTAIILITAGLAWFRLASVLTDQPDSSQALLLVLAIGVVARLILAAADPILEIDFYRYLWDGATVDARLNPYSVAPAAVLTGNAAQPWITLGAEHRGILSQINYPHLKTIYPPVAQAVFWAAHQIGPGALWSLKLVILGIELSGLALLLVILRTVHLPLPWAAIYWWNPLIAVQFANGMHMDALLLPFLLGALLLAAQQKPTLGTAALSLAAGVKVWPVLLFPLLVRHSRWRIILICFAIAAGLGALLATPIVIGRLDTESGFVAYAGAWSRNSAAFELIESLTSQGVAAFSLYTIDEGKLARLLVALLVGLTALIVAWRSASGTKPIMAGALIITATLFLLSPTGYPWYYAWMLPFLAIFPVRGLMLLGVLLPIYYLRFDMEQLGMAHIFDRWVVWIEFGPVFALLIWDWLRRRGVC